LVGYKIKPLKNGSHALYDGSHKPDPRKPAKFGGVLEGHAKPDPIHLKTDFFLKLFLSRATRASFCN